MGSSTLYSDCDCDVKIIAIAVTACGQADRFIHKKRFVTAIFCTGADDVVAFAPFEDIH